MIKYIVLAILGIGIAAGVLIWSDHHDKELTTWADAYEICVKAEYHTTPSAWYADHGEYPTCAVK